MTHSSSFKFYCIALLFQLTTFTVVKSQPLVNFPMDQSPIVGTNLIQDFATSLTTSWGTVTKSSTSPLPTLVSGARPFSGSAWKMNNASIIKVTPNSKLASIGDIVNTTGISISYWSKRDSITGNIQSAYFSLGPDYYHNTLGGGMNTSVSHKTMNFSFGDNSKISTTTVYSNDERKIDFTQWHHFVMTFDFRKVVNNIIIYEDGVAKKTQTYIPRTSFNYSNALLCIGGPILNHQCDAYFDEFQIYSNALKAAEVAQLYNSGTVTNYFPVVLITADQTDIAFPTNTVGLHAKVTDDGLPGATTVRWKQMSGPGTVFSDSTALNPTATFSGLGTYVLRCTASDGQLKDTADITIKIAGNKPPVIAVHASLDSIKLSGTPTTVNLTGWATDDGYPNPPATFTSSWSLLSGPAAVVFAHADSVNSTVTLPSVAGTYILRLSCSDSKLSTVADVKIKICANQAPILTAGVTLPILLWPSNTFALTATATDDGKPLIPGTLSYQWTKTKGTGTVTFGNANALNTTATCSTPGLYRLKLTVTDGEFTNCKEFDVNLWDKYYGCAPPKSIRRLSPNPPAFEHPRVFFTKADRPDLINRIANDTVMYNAVYGTDGIKVTIAATIDNPTSVIGSLYKSLVSGDETVDTKASVLSPQNTTGINSDDIYSCLLYASYMAWIEQDNPLRLQQLATAVATAAKVQNLWWKDGECYFKLALCYDLMYDWMTEVQRQECRQVIAKMTRDEQTAFWMTPTYNRQNWIMEWMFIIIGDYAIEGEPGYDAISTQKLVGQFTNFHNCWGTMDYGFNGEGMGYYAFGMRWGAQAAVAIARRDTNVFVTTNLSKSNNEAFYEMPPWCGGKMFDHHDGMGWSGSCVPTYYTIMKYMYPEDKTVDLVYRNSSAATNSDLFCRAVFGVQPLSGNTNYAVAAPSAGMGLAIFDNKRGAGVARSDWSENAVQLDFESRFDLFGSGHGHSDRNNFTLMANGRLWVADLGYMCTANDEHSTVLIDGRGQSGSLIEQSEGRQYPHWPGTQGKMVDYQNDNLFTSFAGDAKFAYDYSVPVDAKGNDQINDPQMTHGVPTTTRWRDLWYNAPAVLTGSDSLLNNFIRVNPIPYNTVVKAFRSATLVRGNKPYVLIVDDIQKDANTHTYDWMVNTNCLITSDLDMAMLSSNNTDAIFYRTRDKDDPNQPRLLMRVIDGKGDAVPIQIVNKKDGLDRQVNLITISRSNVVSPDFKILLYPHFANDVLPTTTFDGSLLTLTMGDGQKDNVTFTPNADGRTRVKINRLNGQFVGSNLGLAAPTAPKAVTGDDEVSLCWNVVSGATAYNVKRATVSGGPYTIVGKNIPLGNYNDTLSINNGTTYYYVVSAVNAGGEGANSAQVSVRPLPALPIATGLTVTPGNAQVGLSWNSIPGATTYNVKRSTTPGGPYTNIATGNFVSYTDKSASNGTTYYYAVSALNMAGEGALSTEIRTAAIAIGAETPQAYTAGNILPGVVEAENYDNGGEGVAYHDLETSNVGAKYRKSEGVDLDSCSAGGYCVSSTKPGEWLVYTVNAKVSMTYTTNILVSALLGSGKLHIEIDGVNQTGSIAVCSTGSLQYYNTLYAEVKIPAGTHQVRVVVENGEFNLDKIVFLPSKVNPIYNILSKVSAKAIDVKDASLDDNVVLQMNTIDKSKGSQQWLLTTKNDFYKTVNFSNVNSGKVIGVNTSTAPVGYSYKNPIQMTYANSESQVFRPVDMGSGFYRIVCGDNYVHLGITNSAENSVIKVYRNEGTDSYLFNFSKVQYAQLPYNGKAFQLPCTIEAEDFDLGGEGQGYYDLDNLNTTTAYRIEEGVDIESTGDGYDVTSTQSGEWLEYTIYAPSTYNYPVAVRVASTVSSGKFHINIDGVTKVATKTVNATGGNAYWVNITDTIKGLTAGYHKLRLLVDAPGFNVDNITLSYPKPVTPMGLYVQPGNAKVSLSWKPVMGATMYNVYRSTSMLDINTLVASNLIATNFDNLGLTNGASYYYSVSAMNQWGEGLKSPTITATPMGVAGNEQLNSVSVNVFPNPASVNINISNADNAIITILDGLGNVVTRAVGSGAITTIPVLKLTSGMYILQIKKEEQIINRKIMIVR